jgi:putative RNase toxin 43 of polymorphic toxin system
VGRDLLELAKESESLQQRHRAANNLSTKAELKSQIDEVGLQIMQGYAVLKSNLEELKQRGAITNEEDGLRSAINAASIGNELGPAMTGAGASRLVKQLSQRYPGIASGTAVDVDGPLTSRSGDLNQAANAARNQPYGGNSSASPSPGANTAGSTGRNIQATALSETENAAARATAAEIRAVEQLAQTGPAWQGAGPIPGTFGVRPATESVNGLQNFYPRRGAVEFVFDLASSTFVVGNGTMKHSELASSIGAEASRVVGGVFSRGPNGSMLTNEASGHFWQNWTPQVRQQFVDFMNSKGLPVIHRKGM